VHQINIKKRKEELAGLIVRGALVVAFVVYESYYPLMPTSSS
jgi:hypothetical protein